MTASTADTIFINGKIMTLDPIKGEAQAVAIANDRILSVGTEKEVMAHKSSTTKVIDLKGRRAIPGLIDSHIHVIRGGT